MTSYSVNLAPHACKMLRISGTTLPYTVLDLKFGRMLGSAFAGWYNGALNNNAVYNLEPVGNGVEVKNIAVGNQLTTNYYSGSNGQMSLYVNGTDTLNISFPAVSDFRETTVSVNIPNGATLRFQTDNSDTGVVLDKIRVSTASGDGSN